VAYFCKPAEQTTGRRQTCFSRWQGNLSATPVLLLTSYILSVAGLAQQQGCIYFDRTCLKGCLLKKSGRKGRHEIERWILKRVKIQPVKMIYGHTFSQINAHDFYWYFVLENSNISIFQKRIHLLQYKIK
jgi:hypothetical protein